MILAPASSRSLAAWISAGLLVLALGRGWLHSYRDAAIAESRAEAVSDSLRRAEIRTKTYALAADSVLARRARADSARFTEIQKQRRNLESLGKVHEAAAQQHEVAAVSAGASLVETLDSLRARVPEVLVPVVDSASAQNAASQAEWTSTAASLRAEIDAQAKVISLADSTTVLLRGRLELTEKDRDAWKATSATQEASLITEREQKEYWRRKANPGLFGSIASNWQPVLIVGGFSFVLGVLAN